MIRAFRTLPPDPLVRPSDDALGREFAVLRRMPLSGDLWKQGRQRIRGRCPTARAGRTALSALGAMRDRRRPLVIRPLRALPPDLLVRAGDNVVRRELRRR